MGKKCEGVELIQMGEYNQMMYGIKFGGEYDQVMFET